MRKGIREVLSKYRNNQPYTTQHAEQDLLNLFGEYIKLLRKE